MIVAVPVLDRGNSKQVFKPYLFLLFQACVERGLVLKSDSENSEALSQYIRMTTMFEGTVKPF